ncbi:hypothetical protein BD779DRAFT_544735 [Infundibulicybe gibba]|nr:hypothetical protein BD779DRAFT_544735 [Infundibulicybe gibba]
MSSGRPGFKSIWRSAIQGNPQRASTVFSRPAAPSVTEPFLPLEGVIKNINTSPNNTQVSPPPRPVDSVPSPSMESPARKAAAHPEDQPIPSSLVGGASTMDPRSPPPLTTQHPAALSPVTESSRRETTPPEGHVLIGPSRLAQGAAISDTASPAKGHIPPILSPPTVAEPKVFTSELGDLLQRMRDVDPILPSPPSIYELESCAIVPNTPNEPATALQTVPQPLASPRPLPLSPEPSIRGIGSAWSVFTSSIITTPPSPTPSIATSLIITTPPSPTPSIATSLIITTPPSPAPPEILPMDCGMQPSYLHSPGRGTPRHRMPPQGLDQVKVDGGGGCTQVGWVVPFSLDSRPRNSHQQGSEEKSPDGGYNVTCSPEIPDTSAPGSCSGYDSHLQSPANPYRAVASSEKPLLPQDDRPFHAHGWVEYLLPDESLYYVHPVYQVVTDVDLGGERLLDTMTAYLEDHSDVILPGQELWLRDVGSCEGGFIPLRWLVDHQKQTVAFYSSREANGDGKHHGCEDDRLDAKYRYWSFMEAHPAHVSLSSGAHQDALNALNWASTGGLLPSRHSTPAPFTREECQSLTALLQSIRTSRSPHQIEVV